MAHIWVNLEGMRIEDGAGGGSGFGLPNFNRLLILPFYSFVLGSRFCQRFGSGGGGATDVRFAQDAVKNVGMICELRQTAAQNVVQQFPQRRRHETQPVHNHLDAFADSLHLHCGLWVRSYWFEDQTGCQPDAVFSIDSQHGKVALFYRVWTPPRNPQAHGIGNRGDCWELKAPFISAFADGQ